MNKLLAAIAAIGTGIMGMAGGLNYARAFPVQIPISGLPSVTVNSNATLIAGQPTSLGDLITYNPGVNTQCQFVDYPNGGVTGTGPCSISYSILEIYPNPAYTIVVPILTLWEKLREWREELTRSFRRLTTPRSH